MAKLSDLTLDELYAREKKTPAVIENIISKSDFSSINTRYCETICKLKCKSYDKVQLLNSDVDVLFIQESTNLPGRYDKYPDQQDKIQQGIFEFICQQVGFASEGIRYKLVNLLKCKADKVDFVNNKAPALSVLKNCSPYLESEIKRCKPKVIVSLSTSVTKALGLTKHSNTGNRGQIVFTEYGPVVISLHPKVLSFIRQNATGSSGMWGPDYFNVVKRDFQKAKDLIIGKLKLSPTTLKDTVTSLMETGRIRIAASLKDVQTIVDEINALPPDKIISWDTETTTVDPASPTLKLLSCQFGWTCQKTKQVISGVIPLWHRENKAYDPEEAWKLIEPILVGPRGKVGHNIKYDVLITWWAKGIRVTNIIYDTLLLQHSIESGTQGCYGLKAACWDHIPHTGLAGYEDDLGSLAELKKQRMAALNADGEVEEEKNEELGQEEGLEDVLARVLEE